MTDVDYRPARPADAPDIARVHLTSWRATYGALLPDSHWELDTLELRTERWRSALDQTVDAPSVMVATADGTVVGFAMAGEGRAKGEHGAPCELELYALYVDAGHHGTGVATELLDRALPPEHAAFLWVAAQNPRAIRFYEKNGFVLTGNDDVDDTAIRAVQMLRNAARRL